MVASEMFMDSAQLFNSVVSHSKELNYLPRSATSSAANISFIVTATGVNGPLLIPSKTTFMGTNSNGAYSFSTAENNYYTSSNTSNNVTTYNVNNLLIYEGQYITDSFIMDYTSQNQQFILSNPNIDVSSLVITVTENNTNTIYNKVDNLYNLQSNSNIFFIQAAQDGLYEILFGDNLFGHTPLNSSLITANYRVSSGAGADGVSAFTLTYNLGSFNNGVVSIQGSINSVSNSSGGGSQESINSIKFNAPRYFATQERAVAADDYSALILANFGGDISDVSVYGGELLTPKRYGSTAVCLKPKNSTITPNYIKTQISNFLNNYISLPNKVILTDPDYFYCKVVTNVNFSTTITGATISEIENKTLNTIVNYSNNNLQMFNGNLRYSQLGTYIDNSDASIISNDTTLLMIKRIAPVLNNTLSFVINFNNAAEIEDWKTHLFTLSPSSDEPAFWSDKFTFVDINGISYPNSALRDDNYGNIIVYNTVNGINTIINANIGSINYTTGLVQLNGLIFGAYSSNYINMYLTLDSMDVMVSKNQILVIDPNDVYIKAIPSTSRS
jgi:hypothetical protein